MAQRFRVGVAGLGVGRGHVAAFRALPEQFEVVALCDIDEAKALAIAASHDVSQVTTDFAALCRMADLDVVDICTPSFLHFDQVLAALAAGKHVILEKPAAGSLREVDALIAAERRSGLRVMPIFQYRFGVGAQKLRFLVEQGVAGRAYLTTLETAWRRGGEYYARWHGRWATELGGPLVTLAVHANDVLYHILGPARSVYARAKTLVNAIETEDCVAASLEMADGSLATLAVTTGSAQQISRMRYCFSNLTAESNLQPYTNTSEPWTFTPDSPEIAGRIEEALARFSPAPEGFVGQFCRYYQAMQHGGELPVTLADARASLELITALYHSIATGQPVELPIGPDHPKYAGWR